MVLGKDIIQIGVGPFGEGMVVAKRLAHGPQLLQGPFLQAGDPKDGVGNPGWPSST